MLKDEAVGGGTDQGETNLHFKLPSTFYHVTQKSFFVQYSGFEAELFQVPP